jgi:hypothetical protein
MKGAIVLALCLFACVTMAEEIFAGATFLSFSLFSLFSHPLQRVVELQTGQDATQLAAANGFENLGQITPALPNFYRFKPVSGGPHATRSVSDRSVALRANPAVINVEKQEAKQRVTREEAK